MRGRVDSTIKLGNVETPNYFEVNGQQVDYNVDMLEEKNIFTCLTSHLLVEGDVASLGSPKEINH